MLDDPVKTLKFSCNVFLFFSQTFSNSNIYLGQAESKLEKPCSIAYLELTARDPGSWDNTAYTKNRYPNLITKHIESRFK